MLALETAEDVPQSLASIAWAIRTDAGTPNLFCVFCAVLTRLEMNLALALDETAFATGG